MLWWVLGINVPVVMGVLAGIVANITSKGEIVLILLGFAMFAHVSYTHLTLPTILRV